MANNIDNFGVIPGQALGLALITVVASAWGPEDWDQVRAYTKRLVKLTYLCTWGSTLRCCLVCPHPAPPTADAETQWYAAVLIFIHNGCAQCCFGPWPSPRPTPCGPPVT